MSLPPHNLWLLLQEDHGRLPLVILTNMPSEAVKGHEREVANHCR